VGLTGAQGLYGIDPDLTVFGKVIGGGMPVGAFGGSAEVMDHIAPDGPVYQAGTLSGNPVAMAAGLETLRLISEPGFFEGVTQKTAHLTRGLKAAADRHGVSMCTQHVGAMMGVFFTALGQVRSFSEVMSCDAERFNAFFHGMLDRGVYLAPSAFEAGFVSSAHSTEDLNATIEAAADTFSTL
jgi:glutamate-1-semialdehyde 2,1-aminomutase